MTAKKKVVKKEIKKEVVEEKILSPYKPVFLPMEFEFTKKVDANYYGIKQYLKNVMGLDLFKKVNGNKKEDKPIKNYWQEYCDWWNKNFNKGV